MAKGDGSPQGILSNREYTLPWTWKELGTIHNEVEPHNCVRLQTHCNVWMDHTFSNLKKDTTQEYVMIEESIQQGLIQPLGAPSEMLTS